MGHRRRELRKGNSDGSAGYRDDNDPVDELHGTARVDTGDERGRDAEP